MSLATQFFASVLAENNRQALYLVNPIWFTDPEMDAYQAITEHIRLYGQLPSAHTMRQQGFNLPRAEEPVEYYITRLPERAIHTYYREQFPNIVELLERRDVASVTAQLRVMLEYATVTGNSNLVRTMEQEIRDIATGVLAARATQESHGLTTGYAPLDIVTGGLQAGDMYALVGRPGMGKSYTLFHMANSAWLAGASILIVSMEMSVRQCARRIVGMNTGLSPDAIRRGQVSNYALEGFLGAMDSLGQRENPMHFLAGDFEKTVGDVDVLVQELRPDVLYFDSAYLAAPSQKKQRASRREYVADTMSEIKGIGIRRNIPTVISTQFNREASKAKVPELHMIGEADAIGQMISVGVAIGPGAGAFANIRRTHTLLKNREGEDDLKFDSHFRFSPMNFQAIPGTERTRDGRNWVRGRTDMDDALDAAGLEVTSEQVENGPPEGYDD